MDDKKSVVVTLVNKAERQFIEEEGLSYDFEIGEYNGCLSIAETRESDSESEEEEVVVVYAAHMWAAVRSVELA